MNSPLHACRGEHGMRVKVARIFYSYVPRMHPDDGRVVSSFTISAPAGRDAERRGYTPTRSVGASYERAWLARLSAVLGEDAS